MPDNIQDGINSSNEYIKRVIDKSKSLEKDFLKIIQESILSLGNLRGRIELTKDTSKDIIRIAKEISDAIKKGGYPNDISKLLRDINDVSDQNIKVLEEFNDQTIKIDVRPEQSLIIDEISDRLASPESFSTNITNEVRKIIVKNVLEQKSIKELISDLELSLLSNKAGQGIVTRYVNQIATDAVLQYKGSVNQKIKEKYQYNALRYVGSLIETSRPQCQRWITTKHGILLEEPKEGKLDVGVLSEEIKYVKSNIYNSNKVSGYGLPGKSYYIELTEQNFITFRGGYGCRHEAIPFKYSQKSLERTERLSKQYNDFINKAA